MPIKIEVKVPEKKPATYDFETVPRVGEKINVNNKRWQVTEVVHYKSGSEFQVAILVSPIN